MDGPLPSWLVGRAANGQASEVNDFKLPFFKGTDFVRSFKSLEHYFKWGHLSESHLAMVGVRRASAQTSSTQSVPGLLHDLGVGG